MFVWAHLGAPALLPPEQSRGTPAVASQLISPISAHGCPCAVLISVCSRPSFNPFPSTAHGKDPMSPETLQNFTLHGASGQHEQGRGRRNH